MGTPPNERTKAYRKRLAEQGHKRLSLFLSADAHTALLALQQAKHPELTLSELVSAVLTGKIPSPGHSLPVTGSQPDLSPGHKLTVTMLQPHPSPGHSLPVTGSHPEPLPNNSPSSRAKLATLGHQWRKEGIPVSTIAERFNAKGWTPDQVPQQEGTKPRADAAKAWTVKTVSQLLTRDYRPPD